VVTRYAAVVLGVTMLIVAPARGQAADDQPVEAAPDDEARARDLFFAGHEAADRGDHATACTKFAESLALFRRVSTLLNLGKCSEATGEISSALRYWTEGAALLEPQDARMTLAKERIATLDARVPVVSLTLPSPVPDGAVVEVDGRRIDRTSKPLRLAPGAHRIALRAPGREVSEQAIDLVEGAREAIVLSLGPPIAEPDSPTPTPATVPSEGLSGLQIGGIVTGAVGLAGIAAGAVTGALVLDRKSTVNALCQDDQCDSDEGVDAAQSGRTLSQVSTVAFVVGGAAVTAGVLMLILGGDDEGDQVALLPTFSLGGAGATFSGRF
jgi:hypothetical protein